MRRGKKEGGERESERTSAEISCSWKWYFLSLSPSPKQAAALTHAISQLYFNLAPIKHSLIMTAAAAQIIWERSRQVAASIFPSESGIVLTSCVVVWKETEASNLSHLSRYNKFNSSLSHSCVWLSVRLSLLLECATHYHAEEEETSLRPTVRWWWSCWMNKNCFFTPCVKKIRVRAQVVKERKKERDNWKIYPCSTIYRAWGLRHALWQINGGIWLQHTLGNS